MEVSEMIGESRSAQAGHFHSVDPHHATVVRLELKRQKAHIGRVGDLEGFPHENRGIIIPHVPG